MKTVSLPDVWWAEVVRALEAINDVSKVTCVSCQERV
jgi:hypothetical protein